MATWDDGSVLVAEPAGADPWAGSTVVGEATPETKELARREMGGAQQQAYDEDYYTNSASDEAVAALPSGVRERVQSSRAQITPEMRKQREYERATEEVRLHYKRRPEHVQANRDLKKAESRLPFVGSALGAADSLKVVDSARRFQKGEHTQEDLYRLAQFQVESESLSEEEKAKPWYLKVRSALADMVPYAIEFAATGGAYTAGRKGAAIVAEKALGGAAKSMAGRIATAVGSRAAGVAAQSLANPARIAENTAQQQLSSVLSGNDQSFLQALPAGVVDTVAEIGSERAGGLIGKVAGKLIPGKLKTAIADAWMKQTGRGTQELANQIASRTGWNGLLGELGEERTGEVIRGVFGQMGVGDFDFGVTGKLAVGDPEGLAQLGIEAATMAIPGLASGSASLAEKRVRLEQLETLRTTDSRDLKREAAKLGLEGTRSEIRKQVNSEAKQIQKEIQRAQEVQPEAEVRPDEKRTWEQTGQGAAKATPEVPVEAVPTRDELDSLLDSELEEPPSRSQGTERPVTQDVPVPTPAAEAAPADEARVEELIKKEGGRTGHKARDKRVEEAARKKATEEAELLQQYPPGTVLMLPTFNRKQEFVVGEDGKLYEHFDGQRGRSMGDNAGAAIRPYAQGGIQVLSQPEAAQNPLSGPVADSVPQPASAVAPPTEAAPESDPPVPEGMTRLYHGGAHGRYTGPAWFSSNREYAANYRPGAQLQYVDVPTEWADKETDPDGYGNTVAKGFQLNVEIKGDEFGPRRPLTPADPNQVYETELDTRPEAERIAEIASGPESPREQAQRKQQGRKQEPVQLPQKDEAVLAAQVNELRKANKAKRKGPRNQPDAVPAPEAPIQPPEAAPEQVSDEEYDGILNQLRGIRTSDDLKAIRPLMEALYPEYADKEDGDDPWGIRRAIFRGNEMPRFPTVELNRRIREAKQRGTLPAPTQPQPPSAAETGPEVVPAKETLPEAAGKPKKRSYKKKPKPASTPVPDQGITTYDDVSATERNFGSAEGSGEAGKEAGRKRVRKAKKSGEPQTLLQAVQSLGGLSSVKLSRGERVNISEDLNQSGLRGALRNYSPGHRGTKGKWDLEEMARELESGGHWKAPEGANKGDALLQALKDGAKTFAGMEQSDSDYDKEYAAYQAQRDQEERDAQEYGEEAEGLLQDGLRAGAEDGAKQSLIEAGATESEAAEVLGEVDDSFDFGANVKPSIAGEQQGLFEKESQGSLFNVSRRAPTKSEKGVPQRSELEQIEDELKAGKAESLPGQKSLLDEDEGDGVTAKLPKGPNKPKTKLSEAAEAAHAEAKAALDDLGKTLKAKGLPSNPMLDPELMVKVGKVVLKYAKANILDLAVVLQQFKERYGQRYVDAIKSAMVSEWNKLQATGEFKGMKPYGVDTPPPLPPKGDSGETTGTKNAKTDELREKTGMEARPPVERESVEQWQAEAKQRMAEDPDYARKLAEELAEKPRALKPVEEAALGLHLRDLENRRQDGEDVADELRTAIEADERVGTIWGRAGVARQVELAADFSVSGLTRQYMRAVNEQPSDEQMEKFAEQADRIQELEGELKEKQQKLAQAEVDLAIAEAKASKATSQPPAKRGTKRQLLEEKASAAVANFKEKWAALKQMGAVADSGRDADQLIEVTKAAVEVVKAYSELGVNSFLEFLSRVKKDFGKITADQRDAFRSAWNQTRSTDAPERRDNAEIGAIARKLTRFAVESGISERDAVVDAVHEELKGMGFEVSRSDTMAAMSGYGDFRELPKDEVSVKIRGINGELQQILKLEDMQAGQAPKKTGVERREPTDEERRLIKLVNEGKKRGGYKVTDPAKQLKSALGAAKTSIRHRITDLENAIAKREKIVSGQTKLTPDAELTGLQKQRDQLNEQYKAIFPAKKSVMSEAARLKMAEKLLDRHIADLQADLKAGRLDPKSKSPALSSPEIEAKQRQLELLKATREQARAASPEYQAKEAAKQLARYKQDLQRQLALWEQRRAEAAAGILPKKRKTSPVDKEILETKYQIEQVKRHAQAEIEEAARAQRGMVGKALGFGGDLLDLSRMVWLGLEASPVLLQGAFFTYGFPIKSSRAIMDAARAAVSRRADFALHDNLMQRKDHAEYVRGDLETTASDGPLSHREEFVSSRIASWLASTEGAAWALPRWAAEGLLGLERAVRTFMNTMRADLFDYQKASIDASRPGTWSEDDAKVVGNSSNVFSGRGKLPFGMTGVGAGRVFLAPRWVWSRAQLLVGQPLWKGDRATRLAVGKVYVRAALGYAAVEVLRHAIYSLTADDDDDKPKYELDPRSSDFGKRRLGETRTGSNAGLTTLVVLAARLAKGETKLSNGKIVPIRGDDVPYGADDSFDLMSRFVRSKLAPLPSGVIDWIVGKDIVGNKATVGSIIAERTSPMTWGDIFDAERELGVKQGTVAAIDAFIGNGLTTYGDRTRYRDTDEAGRKEIIDRDLKNMSWADPDQPAYSEFLTDEQREQFRERRVEKRQQVLLDATFKPVRKNYKSDETYQEAIESRDKNIGFVQEMKAEGVTRSEAVQLLRKRYKGEGLSDRLVRLKEIYGE